MSDFFTTRELTQLRAVQERSMDRTCVIRTTPEVPDNQGGMTLGTPVDVASTCRIGVPSGEERLLASRIGQTVDVVLTLPWAMAASVSETAQIYVPDVAAPTGIYSVVALNEEQSDGAALRLFCQRVA